MALVHPGLFHRLALAVRDTPEADAWLTKMFGTVHVTHPVRPHQHELLPSNVSDMEGADTQMLWLGGVPIILLGGGVAGGPIANHLQRFGPSTHSLAWEIDDMWTVEHLLRERGIRIAAVNIPGRHFFMHPKDTAGVLMEWTDTEIAGDPRRGLPSPGEGGGVIDVEEMGWMTAVVADASATAQFLHELADCDEVTGNPAGPADIEETVDLRIGDVVVRLVTPRSPRSRFAPVLALGPRLWSYTLRVRDLDAAVDGLGSERIATTYRQDGLVAADPSATLGIPLELVAA